MGGGENAYGRKAKVGGEMGNAGIVGDDYIRLAEFGLDLRPVEPSCTIPNASRRATPCQQVDGQSLSSRPDQIDPTVCTVQNKIDKGAVVG